jgi:hypothetical protein
MAVLAAEGVGVDVLLAERADPAVPGVLRRDRGLAVLAPNRVGADLLTTQRARTRDDGGRFHRRLPSAKRRP